MNRKLPRRTFLLSWLGGLLAGRLDRSQAQAEPSPMPKQTVPNSTSSPTTAFVSDGSSTKEIAFHWNVASAPSIGP